MASRTLLRNVLMWGFHTLVTVLGGVRKVRDTQCGFKLFTRSTAAVLFEQMHVERWCFDVELLYIAQSLRYPIAEVAVNWEEVAGSKLNLLDGSVQMGKDLLMVRLCYVSGLWKVPASKRVSKKAR